ncbi:MAG: hypothetical protein IH934_04785 [Nanoarchaeota archaeon]|nr:hypothetical protein [Nanoarchaeota archaeon]
MTTQEEKADKIIEDFDTLSLEEIAKKYPKLKNGYKLFDAYKELSDISEGYSSNIVSKFV